MAKFNMKSRKASLFMAPRNTTPPTLTGEARVGQTMTFGNAVWSNSPTSYSRHIRREDGTLLATDAATYVPVTADIGSRLIPDETATNTYGSVIAYGSTTEIVAAAQTTTLPATQTITFRDETLAGYGGHDLAYTGTGTLSISSGNASGHWTIDANKHLVPSGTYGATRTTLSGPYTLVVTDGTDSCTVTVNILASGCTIRPTPALGVTDNSTNFQLRGALASAQRRYGDVIDMRPGVYNPSELRFTYTVRAYSQRGGGPVAPTNPYHSWISDSTTKAGFITIQPIEAGTVELRFMEIAATTVKNAYLRFTDITFKRYKPAGSYTTGASLYVTSFNSGKQYAWLQFDNCRMSAQAYPDLRISTNQCSNIFFFDNYYDGGTMQFCASDSWIIGNEMVNTTAAADCIRHALFKQNRDCIIAFNFCHGRLGSSTNDHADYVQGAYTRSVGGGTAKSPELPTGDVDGFWSFGNMYIRGTAATTNLSDGQGPFTGDMPTDVRLQVRHLCDVVSSIHGNGLTLSNAAPGTIFKNNTLIYESGGTWNGQGPPRIRLDNEGQTSATVIIENNVAWTTVANNSGSAPNPSGAIGVTSTNNIFSVPTDTTIFDAPAYGASLSSMAAVLAAFTPKAGGPLLPGGATENIGAIGNGYVNFTNRTITVPGVTLPAYVPAYSA